MNTNKICDNKEIKCKNEKKISYMGNIIYRTWKYPFITFIEIS